jgi:hypothetical protein
LDNKDDMMAQYNAMEFSRKNALKRIADKTLRSRCDLDGMVVPHPFRDNELVRFDTLMAQVEATSELPDSGPGLPQEARYLALLDLVAKHMSPDNSALFRHAAGVDEEGVGNVLREAYGLKVTFIVKTMMAA